MFGRGARGKGKAAPKRAVFSDQIPFTVFKPVLKARQPVSPALELANLAGLASLLNYANTTKL